MANRSARHRPARPVLSHGPTNTAHAPKNRPSKSAAGQPQLAAAVVGSTITVQSSVAIDPTPPPSIDRNLELGCFRRPKLLENRQNGHPSHPRPLRRSFRIVPDLPWNVPCGLRQPIEGFKRVWGGSRGMAAFRAVYARSGRAGATGRPLAMSHTQTPCRNPSKRAGRPAFIVPTRGAAPEPLARFERAACCLPQAPFLAATRGVGGRVLAAVSGALAVLRVASIAYTWSAFPNVIRI